MRSPWGLPCWTTAPTAECESWDWKQTGLDRAATIDLYVNWVWGKGWAGLGQGTEATGTFKSGQVPTGWVLLEHPLTSVGTG